MLRMSMVGIGLLGWLGSVSLADEPKPGNEVVKASKMEKATVATTIDFGGELKLPFHSLITLGARIQEARMAPDPVALAAAARELAAEEKVSGKKAQLTAENLAQEATALAKMRNQSGELEAVSLLLENPDAQTELKKLAEAAKKREADEAEAVRKGVITRGLRGTLTVINKHNVAMSMYVDGNYVGDAGPFSTRYFYVNDPAGSTSTFDCYYPDGSFRAEWNYSGDGNSFRWTLDPNIP